MDEKLQNFLKNQQEKEQGKNPGVLKEEELQILGWQKAGSGINTHVIAQDPKDFLFKPKMIRSAEDLKKEYLDTYRGQGFTEVELVPIYQWNKIQGWYETTDYNVYLK